MPSVACYESSDVISAMVFYKITCILFSLSILTAASVGAVPIVPELTSPEVDIPIEAASYLGYLKVKHPTSLSSLLIQRTSNSEPSDDHISAEVFRTLLSSLTYTINFTSQGRLYTVVPMAFGEKNEELISFRLFPHPEKLQSAVFTKNSILFPTQKSNSESKPKEANTLGSVFWFGLVFLLFLVITGGILWKAKTKTVLRL
ncbi:MAG: hypothetical protein ACPGYT_02990 [Nitrospirales bacterium]